MHLRKSFISLGIGLYLKADGTWETIDLLPYFPDWQGGEILAFAFVNGWSTPLAHIVAQWNLPIVVYDIMTIGVKILQGLLPIGLWMPRYQRWCFLAGAGFHIGVTLIMGMWWFLLLVPLYAAFVDRERPLLQP